jgi:hypothetical protein
MKRKIVGLAALVVAAGVGFAGCDKAKEAAKDAAGKAGEAAAEKAADKAVDAAEKAVTGEGEKKEGEKKE